MPRSGILALESGVRSYETLLDWCEHAIAIYEGKVRREIVMKLRVLLYCLLGWSARTHRC